MSTTPKTLAHLRRELHTPLNHIIGFSKMLLAKLREMPHVGTTPVIIVTAADLSDQERRRLQGGVEARVAEGRLRTGRAARRDSRSHRSLCRRRRTRERRVTMVKILYIEDNEDNLYILSNRLKRRGYEVIAAPDGESGMAMALREQPALILMV